MRKLVLVLGIVATATLAAGCKKESAPPPPQPVSCSPEGSTWAVGGPNGPVCYKCENGKPVEVPCQ